MIMIVMLPLLIVMILIIDVVPYLWTEDEIINYMSTRSRAYFTHLFSKAGFKTGIEVGVAQGRFSELFLIASKGHNTQWHMCDILCDEKLNCRYPSCDITMPCNKYTKLNWNHRNIGLDSNITFHKYKSTDPLFIDRIKDIQFDFIYLDGAHDHENVELELELLYPYLKKGGVMAGHDYCNYGETTLNCKGCANVPKCVPYTKYGVKHMNKPKGKIAHNENPVVLAVQEYMMKYQPQLAIHHTIEHNFTRESLAKDGLDYDLVITMTYNPSWFFIKH